MDQHFEFTSEGCRQAKKYLEDIDKLKELEKELSTDGWTLIMLANSFWEKNNSQ